MSIEKSEVRPRCANSILVRLGVGRESFMCNFMGLVCVKGPKIFSVTALPC